MTDASKDTNVIQFAPKAAQFFEPPRFQYAATQRQIDFAQLVASGGDIVESLIVSSLISAREADTLSRAKLYSLAAAAFKQPAVQEQIDYYRTLHQASMSVTLERVQQELAAVAFSDPADFFYETGEAITNMHQIPRHARAAIKEWSNDPLKGVKVKTHDKLTAVRTLGELQGYFAEADRAKAPQVEINLDMGAPSSESRLPLAGASTTHPARLLEGGDNPDSEPNDPNDGGGFDCLS